MRLTKRTRRLGVSALPALALAAMLAATVASPAAAGPGWGACLECHDDPDLTLTTVAGEELSLTINEAELGASAHKSVGCRGCHPSVLLDEHPEGNDVESRAVYGASAARVCLDCHDAKKSGFASHHVALGSSTSGLSCVGCHGAHGVRKVAAWKAGQEESEYCLTCHGRGMTIMKPGRRPIALDIDDAALAASMHPDHACTDCHVDFSKKKHPVANPADASVRNLTASQVCAGCHEDKMAQNEGGIHFTLLRSGVGAAPGCTDCHSAHEVAPIERLATIAGAPCRRCHGEVFAAYLGSMHGLARSDGAHLDAPLCSNCHRAHDVQGTGQPERIREACLGCHENAPAAHAVWLPNAATHLDAVSCTACHAPEAQRMVALRVVEESTGRTLAASDVAALLGKESGVALDPGGDGIAGLELWSFLRTLERARGGSPLSVIGRLEIVKGVDAHRLSGRGDAVRRCESCHESGSSFFSTVAVRLADDEGRPVSYEAEDGLLASLASIVPLRGFYALGSTRVEVLDLMLVLAFLGGLVVPIAHGSARYIARRHMAKGGRS